MPDDAARARAREIDLGVLCTCHAKNPPCPHEKIAALLRHYDQELARLRARMAELEATRDQVRREVRARLVRPVEGARRDG